MNELVALFGLALLVFIPGLLIALPIIANTRSRRALDAVKAVEARVDAVTRSVKELRRELGANAGPLDPNLRPDTPGDDLVNRLYAVEQQVRAMRGQQPPTPAEPEVVVDVTLASIESREVTTAAMLPDPPPSQGLDLSDSVAPPDSPDHPAGPAPGLPTAETEAAPSSPPVRAAGSTRKRPSSPATRPPLTSDAGQSEINWELFTGARLFAWIGGLALFFGVAFLMKYSIEMGLISPAVRVAFGCVLGAGAVLAGLALRPHGYRSTADALCAIGPAVLYATTFAAHSYFGFIGPTLAFLLMVVWTAGAFMLSVRLDARYIAILALLGGFLTPPLLSTGVDRPLALFGYITLLDIGLAAIALRQGWGFLLGMSAFGTVVMQLGWSARFYSADRVEVAIGVFLLFPLLFQAFALVEPRVRARLGRERDPSLDAWLSIPAGLLSTVSMVFAASLVFDSTLAGRPLLILGFPLLLSLALTISAAVLDRFRPWQVVGGALSFALLLGWTANGLTREQLPFGLGIYLAFAMLHAAFPIVLQRFRPTARPSPFSAAFPVLMLLVILVPIVMDLTSTALLWPAIFLIDAAAVFAALTGGAAWVAIAALVVTMVASGIWIGRLRDLSALGEQLVILGLFALAFAALGILLERRRRRLAASKPVRWDANPFVQLPVLAALMPFALLAMTCVALPLVNPSPIFALGLLLTVLLLGLARHLDIGALNVLTLAAVVMLELSWHANRFDPARPGLTILWYLVFLAIFLAYPLVFATSAREQRLPWVAAAAVGPVQFFLIHQSVRTGFGTAYIGALPLAFAIVYVGVLAWMIRNPATDPEVRQSQLAYLGGVTLLFISLIFPLQFNKEWLTIGWAVLGVALLWLFQRLPHPGLKVWGAGLLAIAFLRMLDTHTLLAYHPRSGAPILNWYLYAYGIVALCMFVAARCWRPRGSGPADSVQPPAVFNALGGILCFLLLNIEIADFFSTGSALTFEFSGNFARDMTYSLAWGLFGMVLLGIAIQSGGRGPRIASLGLLSLTVLKLFFHDLWQLGGLYRVGACIGLAVLLLAFSFLYQKFFPQGLVATAAPPAEDDEDEHAS